MKVSIIVTVYNIEKYIEKCLKSIQNQTYKNIEIIVIDDGSTDNSAEIIRNIAVYDKRIRYIYQKNKGVQSARKKGISVSTGMYILIVDGDDYLDTDCISELVLSSNSGEYDIVYYNYRYIFSDKNNICKPFIADLDYKNANKESFLFNYFTKDMQNGLCLKLIKRSFIEKNSIDFIKEEYKYGEDMLGTIILGMYNPKVFYLNKCLYNYIQRSDSIVNRNMVKDVAQVINIFNYIDNNFANMVFNKYKEEYEYFKYKETYFGYCINGINTEIRKKFYEYWKENDNNILENKYYNKEYCNYAGEVKEKLFYYNLSFDLGENITEYIFSNSKINQERLNIIYDYMVNDKMKRLELYNNLYNQIFKIDNMFMNLKKSVKNMKNFNIIIYGYSNMAVFLKNQISNYFNINNVYIADGYIKKDGVININDNFEMFDKSDLIIITPIHAFERIFKYIKNFGIDETKIISIDKLLNL